MCNFFAFIKWLLPVLRLTEVTVTGNLLHLAGKMLVLVKLIYAKAGLLRPRPRTLPQGQGLVVARPSHKFLRQGQGLPSLWQSHSNATQYIEKRRISVCLDVMVNDNIWLPLILGTQKSMLITNTVRRKYLWHLHRAGFWYPSSVSPLFFVLCSLFECNKAVIICQIM